MRVFALLRFINMPRFHRGICQLEKPPANREITEPIALTICKLEASRESDSVTVTFQRTRFSRGQHKGQNERIKQKQTGLLTFINKSLFVDTSARFCILLTGNDI